MGGGGRVGGGKVKGQLSLRTVATLVVRERMKKALAVQSGRALAMGRCASSPWGRCEERHRPPSPIKGGEYQLARLPRSNCVYETVLLMGTN